MAEIIPLFGMQASNVELGAGYDTVLNSMTGTNCINPPRSYKDTDPPPSTNYEIFAQQVIDQSTADRFLGVNLRASYNAALSGADAKVSYSESHHLAKDRRDYEYFAIINTDQDRLKAANLRIKYHMDRPRLACGDRYIARIIYGYGIQASYHFQVADQADARSLQATISAHNGSGSASISGTDESKLTAHSDKASLSVLGSGLPPSGVSGISFSTNNVGVADFYRFVSNLQNAAQPRTRPGVVAIDVREYEVGNDLGREANAAKLMRKFRQLSQLVQQLNDIKVHKDQYLWRSSDGSYLYSYVPEHPFTEPNNLLSRVTDEQEEFRKMMIECEIKNKFVDCNWPSDKNIDDYDLRIGMPLVAAESKDFAELKDAFDRFYYLHGTFIQKCIPGGVASIRVAEYEAARICRESGNDSAAGAWDAMNGQPNWRHKNLYDWVGNYTDFQANGRAANWPASIPWPFGEDDFEVNVVKVNEIRGEPLNVHNDLNGYVPYGELLRRYPAGGKQ